MASRVLLKIEVGPSQAALLGEVYPGRPREPYRVPAYDFVSVSEYLSEADSEDGSCLTGLFVGLCLEAVMALGVCGIWQLWHMLR